MRYLVLFSIFFLSSYCNAQNSKWNNNTKYNIYQEGNKFGYKDDNGKILIPAEYNQLYDIALEFMILKKGALPGIIDYKGNVIVEFGKYDNLKIEQSFSYKKGVNPYINYIIDPETVGVISVKNSRYGLINLLGKEVLPTEYSLIKYLSSNYFTRIINGKWQIINSLGNVVNSNPYDEISQPLNNFRNVIVVNNGKYGLLELPDKVILNTQYDNITFKDIERYELLKNNVKSIYNINTGAIEELNDSIFYDISFKPLEIIIGEKYKDSLFIGHKNEPKKMGLFDSKKKEIIPPIFDEIYSGFANPNYVVVFQNWKKGLFDLNGKMITDIAYDGFIVSPSDSSVFSALIGGNIQKWIILNDKKVNIFGDDYESVKFLQNNLVILKRKEKEWLLATIYGKIIDTYEFSSLLPLEKDSMYEMYENWFLENDIIARGSFGQETIYINSKGNKLTMKF